MKIEVGDKVKHTQNGTEWIVYKIKKDGVKLRRVIQRNFIIYVAFDVLNKYYFKI